MNLSPKGFLFACKLHVAGEPEVNFWGRPMTVTCSSCVQKRRSAVVPSVVHSELTNE